MLSTHKMVSGWRFCQTIQRKPVLGSSVLVLVGQAVSCLLSRVLITLVLLNQDTLLRLLLKNGNNPGNGQLKKRYVAGLQRQDTGNDES